MLDDGTAFTVGLKRDAPQNLIRNENANRFLFSSLKISFVSHRAVVVAGGGNG